MAEKSRVNEVTLRDGAEPDELELVLAFVLALVELAPALEDVVPALELELPPHADSPTAAASANAAIADLLVGSCN
jgi:hypothetical protein